MIALHRAVWELEASFTNPATVAEAEGILLRSSENVMEAADEFTHFLDTLKPGRTTIKYDFCGEAGEIDLSMRQGCEVLADIALTADDTKFDLAREEDVSIHKLAQGLMTALDDLRVELETLCQSYPFLLIIEGKGPGVINLLEKVEDWEVSELARLAISITTGSWKLTKEAPGGGKIAWRTDI